MFTCIYIGRERGPIRRVYKNSPNNVYMYLHTAGTWAYQKGVPKIARKICLHVSAYGGNVGLSEGCTKNSPNNVYMYLHTAVTWAYQEGVPKIARIMFTCICIRRERGPIRRVYQKYPAEVCMY